MSVMYSEIYPLHLTERELYKLSDALEGLLLEGIDDELDLILFKVNYLYSKVKGGDFYANGSDPQGFR